ncbi:hypothetical protein P154DRAFT_602401 [Amniculicola lignicola CBS 123094]|uniref:Wings apart-like protein C-terminal domain-containing protein n=1 Tax=Amniculicola lignicola CBS 123094 TaxID=1392246 RepID=A0A6A5WAC3_9PLEO|nr:hypothetical protein P154DRAFT_602401 [Amniculicola lignicola CBS 123094]
MSSMFTATDRRKRIATYGKSSRPPPASINWNDDAPSPERPRKKAGVPGGGLKKATAPASGGALKRPAALPLGKSTERSDYMSPSKLSSTGDVFDVPSDDELPPPKPLQRVRKVAPKQPSPADVFDIPSENESPPPPSLPRVKKTVPRHAPLTKATEKPLPKLNQTDSRATSKPTPPVRRAKTPQLEQEVRNSELKRSQVTNESTVSLKAASRATIPVPQSPGLKKAKSAYTQPQKKPRPEPIPEAGIWDIPSDDEGIRIQTSRKPRPAPIAKGKAPIRSRAASAQPSPGMHGESDDSNASRKRKRQGSFRENSFDAARMDQPKAVPQRSKKYQKKADNTSPGNDAGRGGENRNPLPTTKPEPPIYKPRRTKVRTAIPSTRPNIIQGQSSPAKLHGMLAVRPSPKTISNATPKPTMTNVSFEEDETMYDIQAPATPLARSTKPSTNGLVTPRQKDMLNKLLDDEPETVTPAMPSIRRLQLTDRRPGTLLSGLMRSSSDIPQTTFSRKARLVDTLTQNVDGQDSDEEDSGSESAEETDEDESTPNIMRSRKFSNAPQPANLFESTDPMEVDEEPPKNSQPSQTSLHTSQVTKVTYAQRRTYLEDDNPEDSFAAMLDLMDPTGGYVSKAQENVSDEEDDPSTQVRGIHELRTKGRTQKFQMEAQSAIDDISNNSRLGNSIRRTAMLEFANQMVNEDFLSQILDSALGQELLRSLTSNGEIVFDFAAAVTVVLILQKDPGYSGLEQIHQSSIMDTFETLLGLDADINRIAKERKTNLSKIGRESVEEFRTTVHGLPVWTTDKPDKVSPQIIALKGLELLVLGLRKAGSTEALVKETVISKLVEIVSGPCGQLKTGKQSSQDLLILDIAFSIMESVALSKEKQNTWSNDTIRRLVECVPALFGTIDRSPIKFALRLCMNLTNNKPKACATFAGPHFVRPLVTAISHNFERLANVVEEEQRIEVLDTLILSLGTMINLAEFSDQARASVVEGGDELVDALAGIFLEGSERAARADSMEESQSSVTIGYLTVLLGNLCLNDIVREKIKARLPGQKIDVLVEQVKEFVRYHERVDRMTDQFEGAEGRETWHTFTMRLMLVVERLEKTE